MLRARALLAWSLAAAAANDEELDLSAAESVACDLPVVDAASLQSFADFQERFQRPPGPVLLEGLTDGWPIGRWGKEEYVARLGSLDVMVRPSSTLHKFGSSAPFRRVPLREYLQAPKSPGVAFENEFPEAELAVRGEYTVPPLFAQAVHAKPIFSLARRGDGISFHKHHQNWLSQLQGRKAWFFASPDLGEDFGIKFKEMPCRMLTGKTVGVAIQKCVVGPSQTVFVPSRFYHATCNLDDFTVGLGWEGETQSWHPALHATVSGDMDALKAALAEDGDGTCAASGRGASSRGQLCTASLAEGDLQLAVGFATRAGHIPLLQHLLPRTADARAAGAYAICRAAESGRAEIIRALLERRTDVAGQCERGEQPIHLAAQNGHLKVVKLLVAARAEVSAWDGRGENPLLQAAWNGHATVVAGLLKLRADLKGMSRGKVPAQALHRAAEVGHLPVTQLLLRRRAEIKSSLHYAAKGGHSELLDFLLDKGADVHASLEPGPQALHIASAGGHAEAVEVLLRRRADARARGQPSHGRPLHFAAGSGDAGVLDLLLASRASPDEADGRSMRPLHVAAARGHGAAVEQLLAAGAQWALRAEQGGRPEDQARRGGHGQLAERLAAGGCGGLATGLSEACHANLQNYSVLSVDGVVYPPFVSPDAVRELRAGARLRSGDVVVATYPRCGTTWMLQLLLALFADSDETVLTDHQAASRWLEAEAASPGAAEALAAWRPPEPGQRQRRALKTHAPAEQPPWESLQEGAKVIVVARNPKDAAVSNFHHSREVGDFQYHGSWEHFISELFLPGRLVSGSFWDWHATWWRKHLEQPERILWISYEQLSANLSLAVARLAAFLGLQEGPEQRAARALRFGSFEAMRRSSHEVMVRRVSQGKTIKKEHVRSGRVGAWRESFSEEQAQAFDAVHARRCRELQLPEDLFDFGLAGA